MKILWIAAAALVLLGALAVVYFKCFATPLDKTGMVYKNTGDAPKQPAPEEQNENGKSE